jgi:hypothetical protein
MSKTLGTITIPFGAGAGKVLTSDSSGNATWQTPAGGTVPSYTVNDVTIPQDQQMLIAADLGLDTDGYIYVDGALVEV